MIATGFNRCHVSTNEGGVIAEEVYVTAVVDRVETFGTVLLGLTVGCARCHDHKYDPLTQRDFYSLFAYLQQPRRQRNGRQPRRPGAGDARPLPEQAARLAELDGQIAAAETKLAADWPELDAQQVEWERQFVAVEPESVGGSGPEPTPPAPATNAKDYLAVSDWHWVGPFSDPARYLKSKKHGPEGKKKINLAKKFKLATGEEIGWVRKPEWVDGQVYNDLPGDPAANFLYRTITVGKPQDLEISLGSDDGIRVYLNNELLLSRDDSRSAAADQEKLTLKLKRGENHLLVKVLNFAGPIGLLLRREDRPADDASRRVGGGQSRGA